MKRYGLSGWSLVPLRAALIVAVAVFLFGADASAKGKPPQDPPPHVESPDLAIAFVNCGGDLVVSSPDGTLQNVVLSKPKKGVIKQPTWSPLGDALLFAMTRPHTSVLALYLLPIDATIGQPAGPPLWVLDLLHSGDGHYPQWSPAVTPNGLEMVAYHDLQFGDETFLVNINWDGNTVDADPPIALLEIAPLPPETEPGTGTEYRAFAWSPTGDSLAVTVGDGNFTFSDLYVLNLAVDPTNPESLVLESPPRFLYDLGPEGQAAQSLAWSRTAAAGGIAVPYVKQESDSNRDIFLIPIDATAPVLNLTADIDGPLKFVDWSPDDSQIAVERVVRTARSTKRNPRIVTESSLIIYDVDLQGDPILTESNTILTCIDGAGPGRPSWRRFEN